MRTISASNSWSIVGRPGDARCEDRSGLDDGGDFRQRLLTKLVANLREGLPFSIRQPHSSRDLVAQHTILCLQYSLRNNSS